MVCILDGRTRRAVAVGASVDELPGLRSCLAIRGSTDRTAAFADSDSCCTTQNPLDLGIVAASAAGACFGFLWWNTAPARIFMGDTGSLALGGGIAGLAILSRTELLLPFIAGLFLITTVSVILQVGLLPPHRAPGISHGPVAPPLRNDRLA